MLLAESGVKADLRGTATAGTGPDLTGYPHLVYAPGQWGPGVRVASNGVWRYGSRTAPNPIRSKRSPRRTMSRCTKSSTPSATLEQRG